MNAMITAAALVAGLALIAPAGSAETPLAPALCCQAELDAAHELRLSGKVKEAYRIYRAVARRQRDAGEFAGDALWQAAEMSHVLGRTRRAARELDLVAREARQFGRPNLEARALFEASYMYHQAGQDHLVPTRIARIQTLLASPEVSDETRRTLEARMEGDAAVREAANEWAPTRRPGDGESHPDGSPAR